MQRSLIAVVLIALVIAGVVMLGRSAPPAPDGVVKPGPDPAASSSSGAAAPGDEIQKPVTIVLECASPARSSDTLNGVKIMELREAYFGSGKVRYLEVPDNILEEKCHAKKQFAEPPGDELAGKAAYDFEVKRDDTYFVQLKAKWADTCGNSVWFRMDNGPWLFIKDTAGKISEKSYQWTWHPLEVSGQPKGFELKAGKHTLTMAVREDGPCLEKWAVSTSTNAPAGQ